MKEHITAKFLRLEATSGKNKEIAEPGTELLGTMFWFLPSFLKILTEV